MNQTSLEDIAVLRQAPTALIILPLMFFCLAMIVLYALGSTSTHDSPALLLTLNLCFTTMISLFIALLSGRSFLARARPTLLAICIGMTIWGSAALVASVGPRVGNYNITIHNLGLLLSGLCHLVGALPASRHALIPSPRAWLGAGISAGFGLVGLVWIGTIEQWIPAFFVEGQGPTPLRTAVLAVDVVVFLSASALSAERYRDMGWAFLRWYSIGLFAIALGASGLLLQPIPGSWLGWAARGTQYLGGMYMLAGAVLMMRESGGWTLTLEERLQRSEKTLRHQQELLRNVNDNTSELIYMKDRQGRLVYANTATLRTLGKTAPEVIGVADEVIYSHPYEHVLISANDQHVINSGEALTTEEQFTNAEGLQRLFLSTKTPRRDESGQIIGLIGISLDITERKKAEQALREADQRKDEFLATLAHELRNPLAPIRNALSILTMSEGNRELFGQATSIMSRQLDQMVRLIDDLLDVSRVSRGKLQLRREHVDLVAVVHQAIETCQPLLQRMSHRLDLRLPGQPVWVNADPVRVAQVVGNLINNACKFTPHAGVIGVSVETVDGDAVVRVSDNGIGIAPEKLDGIFGLFSQIDTSLEKVQGGLGIGLALAKNLVAMHDGTILAASQGIGRGSEFTVRLPLAAAPDAALPVSESSPPGKQALRIVLADDNVDGVETLATLLELVGHTVYKATQGDAALEAALTLRPEVLILDIGMPVLNGYEVCRRVRQEAWAHRLFIIGVTGLGQDEDRRRSLEAGFDVHLVKPVDTRELLRLLSNIDTRQHAEPSVSKV